MCGASFETTGHDVRVDFWRIQAEENPSRKRVPIDAAHGRSSPACKNTQQHGLEPEHRGQRVASLAAQRIHFRKRHRLLSVACSPGALEDARTFTISDLCKGDEQGIGINTAHGHTQASRRRDEVYSHSAEDKEGDDWNNPTKVA